MLTGSAAVLHRSGYVCVVQVGLRGVEDVEAEDLLESACTIQQLLERVGGEMKG